MKANDYIRLVFIISVTTAVSIAVNRLGIGKENILMLFMVGVLLVTAVTRGYRFGMIASCASVMIFNYFFTEPLHTFIIYSTNDMVLMFFFLIASMISSSLTARFQRQLQISKNNEQAAKLLYEVAQGFLNVTGEEHIVQRGIRYINEHTGYDSAVELIGGKKLYTSGNFVPADGDKTVDIQITGLAKKLGTLKVCVGRSKLTIEQEWFVNTVAAQMGIAIDREYVYNEREKIRIAMEKEHLKSDLLRSISHDLRTPLTGIAGASSYIVERGKNLDRENVDRLVNDIHEQSVWLTTLVENILNMTRIDSGRFEVCKRMEVVDDVVNEAVSLVIGLSERNFKVTLPQELITIPIDGKMVIQVLINLLNNAVNHCPKDCPIELAVSPAEGGVEFSVADGGRGVDPLIENNLFDAFVTSGKNGADGKKGIGLGLTICKAVVEAHGGSIRTGTSKYGGALFAFTLPDTKVE